MSNLVAPRTRVGLAFTAITVRGVLRSQLEIAHRATISSVADIDSVSVGGGGGDEIECCRT